MCSKLNWAKMTILALLNMRYPVQLMFEASEVTFVYFSVQSICSGVFILE